MSKNLSSVLFVVDTTGAFAPIPGDSSAALYNTPRVPDLAPQTVVYLAGDTYAVEYDSTGEVFVQFISRDGLELSDTVLLVRGSTVNISAAGFVVEGVRRAGHVRIAAGSNGAKLNLTNSPSGYADVFRLLWPAGTNGTTGPAGWITIPDPWGNVNAFVSYNPNKSLDVAGVLGGSARRFNSGAPTVANYYTLQFGYVDVQNGVVVRAYPYYDRVIDTAAASGTYGVDAQTYWHPAIFWYLTAAGVAANVGTTAIQLEIVTNYIYKRNPNQFFLDFT
jgi:hypothetical protein